MVGRTGALSTIVKVLEKFLASPSIFGGDRDPSDNCWDYILTSHQPSMSVSALVSLYIENIIKKYLTISHQQGEWLCVVWAAQEDWQSVTWFITVPLGLHHYVTNNSHIHLYILTWSLYNNMCWIILPWSSQVMRNISWRSSNVRGHKE